MRGGRGSRGSRRPSSPNADTQAAAGGKREESSAKSRGRARTSARSTPSRVRDGSDSVKNEDPVLMSLMAYQPTESEEILLRKKFNELGPKRISFRSTPLPSQSVLSGEATNRAQDGKKVNDEHEIRVRTSDDFSRGPTTYRSTNAKLFDHKKDKIPLVKKQAATAATKSDPTPLGFQQNQNLKDKGPATGRSRKAHRESSPPCGSVIPDHSEGYARWKSAVMVDRSESPSRAEHRGPAYFLQRRDVEQIMPEFIMIHEVPGRKYDEDEAIEIAQKLHAEMKAMEVEANGGIESARALANVITSSALQAVVASHRALLEAYFDFLTTTQQSQASASLKKLAYTYKVVDRLWNTAVEPVLSYLLSVSVVADVEVGEMSSELLFSFLYHSYGIFTSLLYLVPTLRDHWVDSLVCLAVKLSEFPDKEMVDRTTWTKVALMWQKLATHISPACGQGYLRLARLLPAADAMDRTLWSSKARCSIEPTFEEIELISHPTVEHECYNAPDQFEVCFVRYHALLREKDKAADLHNTLCTLLQTSTASVLCAKTAFITVSEMHSFLLAGGTTDKKLTTSVDETSTLNLTNHGHFMEGALALFAASTADDTPEHKLEETLPHIFVWLVYLLHAHGLSYWPTLAKHFPWNGLVLRANQMIRSYHCEELTSSATLPSANHKGLNTCLPEDLILRGSVFAQAIWPDLSEVASGRDVDDEEDVVLLAKDKLTDVRRFRVLWLMTQLAKACEHLHFHAQTSTFEVKDELLTASPASSLIQARLSDTTRIAPGYTVVVIDTSILLHDHDLALLQVLVLQKLSIVVPLTVLLELDEIVRCENRTRMAPVLVRNLSSYDKWNKRDQQSTRGRVKKAFTRIQVLLDEGKLRVVLPDGSPLSDLASRDKVESESHGTWTERFVAAAKYQYTQEPSELGEVVGNDVAERSVLLSYQYNVRMAGFKAGVPAVCPSVMRLLCKEQSSLRRIRVTQAVCTS